MSEFVAFVLGMLGGIVAAVGADWFKRRLYRPKLDIGEDDPETADEFSCHAVRVQNKGNAVARQCHAIVSFPDLEEEDLLSEEHIWKVKDLGLDIRKFDLEQDATYLLKPGKGFRKILNEYLSWSPVGNPLAVELYPKTALKVDVCRFIRKKNGTRPRQIQIPSEKGWKSMRAAVVTNRDYDMTLKVVAEDGTCVEANFTIKPLGDKIELIKKVPRNNVS